MIPYTPTERIRSFREYYRTLAVELLQVLTGEINPASVGVGGHPTKEELKEVLDLYQREEVIRNNEIQRARQSESRINRNC